VAPNLCGPRCCIVNADHEEQETWGDESRGPDRDDAIPGSCIRSLSIDGPAIRPSFGAGGSALFVPVGGEAVRWLTQPLEHSVVANPVYSESPSDVAENDVQFAVVFLDDATAGWLIKNRRCGSRRRERSRSSNGRWAFVTRKFSFTNYVCQTGPEASFDTADSAERELGSTCDGQSSHPAGQEIGSTPPRATRPLANAACPLIEGIYLRGRGHRRGTRQRPRCRSRAGPAPRRAHRSPSRLPTATPPRPQRAATGWTARRQTRRA
jgi:hypothetical protein